MNKKLKVLTRKKQNITDSFRFQAQFQVLLDSIQLTSDRVVLSGLIEQNTLLSECKTDRRTVVVDGVKTTILYRRTAHTHTHTDGINA